MALELKLQYRRDKEHPGSVLVVLIHGLMSSLETWTGTGRNWAHLLLSDPELPEVDVALVTYRTAAVNSSVVRWFQKKDPALKSGAPTRVDRLAQELKDELNDSRVARYDTIILVGHSMGGLVAIRYLLEEIERGVAVKVGGYVSLATPFSGSLLAIFEKILPDHKQIQALLPTSDFLGDTRRLWFKHSSRLEGIRFKFCYGEDDAVVPEESAIPPVVSDKWSGAVSLPGGHSEILEVTDHDSKAYRHVRDHIRNVIQNAPPPTPGGGMTGSHTGGGMAQNFMGGAFEECPHGVLGPPPHHSAGSSGTGDGSLPARIHTLSPIASRLEQHRRKMEKFVARFPSEVQGTVEGAANEVYELLTSMDAAEVERFLQRYRFPFESAHIEAEGIAQLWQLLTLLHIASPRWRFYTDDEVANLELQQITLWKRLIHSCDQETMPEVLLALATRRLQSPHSADVLAGRAELFPHRVLIGNVLPIRERSVCRHCKEQPDRAFPFGQILQDFTGEEDTGLFEGVEPQSNTFKVLEGVEVCCTTCIQERALRAQTAEELYQTIRDVI